MLLRGPRLKKNRWVFKRPSAFFKTQYFLGDAICYLYGVDVSHSEHEVAHVYVFTAGSALHVMAIPQPLEQSEV